MTLLAGDPLTRLAFSIHENKGVFALLLGSGLSRAAEIPTGWEITLDLIRRVALARGITERSDWATWYQEQFGKEPNYSALLADLACVPEERQAVIHSYIEPTQEEFAEGKKTPTKAHRMIAQLIRSGHVKVVITTNFDRLLENALREVGVEPTVVASVDQLRGAPPVAHAHCYLLKLHGDYKDARIRNTDEELSSYPPEFNDVLDRLFDDYGLVVCGWSGEWDHALRAALMRAPNRRYPVFWTTLTSLGAGGQQLADQRRATVLQIESADSFFASVQQRVETLEKTRRDNPLSVELLTNTTKRLLARNELRIELDELVEDEVKRLIRRLEEAEEELSANGTFSDEAFLDRVRRYEAMTEPVARVSGVLGRWGSAPTASLVLDAVRSILRHSEGQQSGLVVWLALRSYPAVLVFTCYGLGLLRGGRIKELHDFFRTSMAVRGQAAQPLVETLFLWAWRGGDDTWKRLPGLDRRRTPLSDHLLDVTKDWASSFVGPSNFEELFERFEALGSLAHLERNSEEALASSTAGGGQPMAWMPMGRIGWHSETLRTFVEELQTEEARAALLASGFARGSSSFLDLFLKNLGWFAGRMSW